MGETGEGVEQDGLPINVFIFYYATDLVYSSLLPFTTPIIILYFTPSIH